MNFTLVIDGAPRTKKNSLRRMRFGKFDKQMPSEAFMKWQEKALWQLRQQWKRPPIARPTNMRALVYRDTRRGDLIGYLQGIADVLERGGVFEDDKWIEAFDGSRMFVDKPNARVVVTLEDLR